MVSKKKPLPPQLQNGYRTKFKFIRSNSDVEKRGESKLIQTGIHYTAE
jgi:hypothetical protein